MRTVSGGIVALATGLILGLSTSPVAAQLGPILSGAGPINQSMGGAATAAPLSASGALLWNPATLAGLDRSELDVGAELLFPQTSLSSSVPANTFGPGVPPLDLSGTTRNEDAVFALPTISLAYRPDQSPLTYGLGVFGIAGFGLDYAGSPSNPVLTAPPPNGVGFGPIYSQYQVLQIAPALVYEVNDHFSVSVSPLLNIGQLQLDPAVFAAPDDANADGLFTYPRGTHSRTAWGAGFSLGAYYTAGDWGFGANYRSPQWFDSFSFNTTNELGQPRTVEFNLDLPAIVSIGTSYKGIDRWLLAADLRYLDFKNADGLGDSGFAANGALRGIGFESIFAIALGAQYQMTDALALRAGYSWNENPIPDSQTAANVASPLIIEHILSAGASYQVTDDLTLSLAYSHAFENSVTGPIVLPMGAIPGTSITSTAAVDMLFVGATVKFGSRKCRPLVRPTAIEN